MDGIGSSNSNSFQLYFASTVIWSVLLIGWLLNGISHRIERNPLQKQLIPTPVMKVASNAALLYYYSESISSSDSDDLNSPSYILSLCLLVLLQIVLFATLIVIAKGLHITRVSLDPVEVRSIGWNCFFLGVSLAAFFFVSIYFVFPLVVTYVVVFGHIYSGIASNLRALSEHLLALLSDEIAEEDPVRNRIAEQADIAKFKLFKNIQKLITLFLTISVVNYLVNPIFLNEMWVRSLIDEISFLLLVAGIGWLLRLRDFSTFRGNGTSGNSAAVGVSGLPAAAENEPSSSSEDEAQSRVEQEEFPEIIVVANPPSVDGTGKVVKENIVMGRRMAASDDFQSHTSPVSPVLSPYSGAVVSPASSSLHPGGNAAPSSVASNVVLVNSLSTLAAVQGHQRAGSTQQYSERDAGLASPASTSLPGSADESDSRRSSQGS
eukprot:ANDGO_04361.mRNA.1 hypothetical protein GUITHDRAFT_164436